MSHLEEKIISRWSGRRFVLGSLAMGIAGTLPLLLYIAFGPRDGNPIGLGLLAVFTVPCAAMGIFIGLVKMLVEFFGKRG